MAGLPAFSGKTSPAQLTDIPGKDFGDAIFAEGGPALTHFEDGGLRFDLLWSPDAEHDRLFVLFSGDAMRNKFDPPVFQRWTWAPHFPGHCLYISDPAVYIHKSIGLAWYAGTQDYDPMPKIIETIRRICALRGVPPENVFAYGSSGGGFAALRMAAMMPEAGAIAINPQTVVTEYQMSRVERYLRHCFGGRDRAAAMRDFPDRLSLLRHARALAERRIAYIQNTLDTHHYEQHYKPFCAAMGVAPEANEDAGLFRRLLFSHEGGHKKAETPKVFHKAMALVTGESWA